MKKEKKVKKEVEVAELPPVAVAPVKEVISETSEDLGQVGINALAKKVNEIIRKLNA